MILSIGDSFTSFSGLQGALEIFKKETNTEFYICGSKTLDSVRERYPRRVENAPAILKYYNIKYICKYGGNFRRNGRSMGLRNTSTRKLGCDAFFYLTLSEDSQALVISSLCLEHNHDINETFLQRPQKRRDRTKELRVKLKSIEVYAQEKLKNKKVPLVQKMIPKEAKNAESSVFVAQDLSNLNVSSEYAQMSGPHEAESMNNPVHNASHFVQEGSELESGEKLCRCGFGTWELTKQDLMLMEVEEHNHRLEIIQLQEAFQIERKNAILTRSQNSKGRAGSSNQRL